MQVLHDIQGKIYTWCQRLQAREDLYPGHINITAIANIVNSNWKWLWHLLVSALPPSMYTICHIVDKVPFYKLIVYGNPHPNKCTHPIP